MCLQIFPGNANHVLYLNFSDRFSREKKLSLQVSRNCFCSLFPNSGLFQLANNYLYLPGIQSFFQIQTFYRTCWIMHVTTSDMWSFRTPSESTQRTCDIGEKIELVWGKFLIHYFLTIKWSLKNSLLLL